MWRGSEASLGLEHTGFRDVQLENLPGGKSAVGNPWLRLPDGYKQGIPCSDHGVSRRPCHVAALNMYCFLAFKVIIIIITIIILGCFKEIKV